MTNKIIGLSGYAGSGKDEVAKVLVQEFGYARIAFADVLRDIAYAIDPYVQITREVSASKWFGFKEYRYTRTDSMRLQDIIDSYGWDYAKNEFPDVRRLLQRLGTEAGRDILGENIWVDTAFARAGNVDIVVTDVRFPNELEAVKQRNGFTVRVHRKGVGPRNDHPSETSLEKADFDYNLMNHGTLDDLARNARALAESVDRKSQEE